MICPLCQTLNSKSFFQGPNGHYFHCSHCDLIYLDSTFYLTSQDEKKRYDSHQNVPADEKYRNYLLSTFRHIQDDLPPNAKLLDFGCGPTEGLKFVVNALGFYCDSYDPFFFPRDIFEKSFYHGIILSESLEHFYYPQKELENILSLLRSDGKLLIRTERHLGEHHFRNWYYQKDPTHVIFFSIKTFEFIAKRYNLESSFPEKNIVLFRRSIEA